MVDVNAAIRSLIQAKTEINGTALGVIAAERLIDEALELLGYEKEVEPERYEDGVYVITHHQYTTMVNATFIHHGQTLDTMVDMEGNDWKTWALSHGVFDPDCRFCYITPFIEEALNDKTVQDARCKLL